MFCWFMFQVLCQVRKWSGDCTTHALHTTWEAVHSAAHGAAADSATLHHVTVSKIVVFCSMCYLVHWLVLQNHRTSGRAGAGNQMVHVRGNTTGIRNHILIPLN